MDREVKSHLKGIVAIWLTNGNKSLDACNETRYDFFSGGWEEAARVTDELIQDGFLFGEREDVEPTSKGIYEAMS